jgi:hypothetical protein
MALVELRPSRSRPVRAGEFRLPVETLPQPDETTCGRRVCTRSTYRDWGEDEALEQVIARTYRMEHGGTFAVCLACDALRRGYRATIYTCNLMVFDPTWFGRRGVNIAERLQAQRR